MAAVRASGPGPKGPGLGVFVRRHLTREQRRELVIKLRQQGWSFPKIAEVLGVDEKTVRRDHSISAFAEIERSR